MGVMVVVMGWQWDRNVVDMQWGCDTPQVCLALQNNTKQQKALAIYIHSNPYQGYLGVWHVCVVIVINVAHALSVANEDDFTWQYSVIAWCCTPVCETHTHVFHMYSYPSRR